MLVEIKYWIVPIAALIPMVMGFIWYHPKVFGTIWMNVADMTEEKMKSTNMFWLFFLSYIFSCLIGFALVQMTIHQLGFQSMVFNYLKEGGEEFRSVAMVFLEKYGQDFRTFRHGALHGFIGGFVLAFPILAINALFERKNWSYIWINTLYWVVCMTLMGGVVCQFA